MKKLFALFLISVLFVGCNERQKQEPDVIILNERGKTLFYDDEYQIQAVSNSEISYKSDNEFHAFVSDEGLVTARHVGETNILLSNAEDSKSFKVTVRPKSNLYPEPDVKFGDYRSSVKAKFGTPDSETTEAIAYANYSSAAPVVMFLFDSSDKLEAYSVMVKSEYSSLLTDFLLERYQAFSQKDGVFLFADSLTPETTTKVIGLSLYNLSFWQVLYMSNSVLKKSSFRTHEYEEFMRSVNRNEYLIR